MITGMIEAARPGPEQGRIVSLRCGVGRKDMDGGGRGARLDQRRGEVCQPCRRYLFPLAGNPQRIGGAFDGVDAFILMRRDIGDRVPGAPGMGIRRDRASKSVERAGHVAGGMQAEATAVERSSMRRMRLQHALKGSEGRFGVPSAQVRGRQGELYCRVAGMGGLQAPQDGQGEIGTALAQPFEAAPEMALARLTAGDILRHPADVLPVSSGEIKFYPK